VQLRGAGRSHNLVLLGLVLRRRGDRLESVDWKCIEEFVGKDEWCFVFLYITVSVTGPSTVWKLNAGLTMR
jgi:hypothetical protein